MENLLFHLTPYMQHSKGKVIIVGAGPGDPELLTVKAVRWLQKAEVVLTDRLVSSEILDSFVSPAALVIPVGKQCGSGASTPQSKINELMVEHAERGKLVVRLKGGDVSVFSNVLDELNTLRQYQIPYEIVPGITSALGAAAYAGIPLTARDYSRGVRFLTYYKSDMLGEAYWNELAATDDTLVFYMSVDTLPMLVERLKRHGIDKEKKLAVIEQATTPNQRVTVSSLYEYEEIFGDRRLASPSLLIIGKVVSLHEKLSWVANSENSDAYFEPLVSEGFKLKENEVEKLLTA
jgi:uroporphyrin-III C-methyltransferase